MKRAAILMDNGFEELEAMGPVALLRRAGIETDMVSANNENTVTGRFGVCEGPFIPMSEYDFSQVDCLILPGGPHYSKIESNEVAKKVIEQFAQDDSKIVAAICAAPTILGHMGLLKGKNYTCFTSMNEDFGGEYVPEPYVVTDGNLITGRSCAASIEFGFAIMEALGGKALTEEVKQSVYY